MAKKLYNSKRLTTLINKFNVQVNKEQADEVTTAQEQRAIEKQFDLADKIENLDIPKVHIKRFCKESQPIKTYFEGIL